MNQGMGRRASQARNNERESDAKERMPSAWEGVVVDIIPTSIIAKAWLLLDGLWIWLDHER